MCAYRIPNVPSREGRSLRKLSSTISDNIELEIPPARPQINPVVEGILRGELVDVLSSDRTKLLTAEQEKVLWKKEERVRQKERDVNAAIEARKEAHVEERRIVEEEKTVQIQEEKNAVILKRIAERKEQKRIKKQQEEERKAQAEVQSYVNEARQRNSQQGGGWYDDDQQGLLGESSPRRMSEQYQQIDQEQQRRRSSKGSRSGQGQIQPVTELPGEFGDAVWSEAEEYGYSKEFPYPKKEAIINKDHVQFPVENPYQDIEHLLVEADDDAGSEKSSSSPTRSPIPTGRLEGLEKGLHKIDKAAANLQALLGRITDYDKYFLRTPLNSATKKKGGKGMRTIEMDIQELDGGESEYDLFMTDVGTEVKPLTRPEDVNRNMVNKSTQVRARDILMEYKGILTAQSRKVLDEEIEKLQLEELDAQAALEEYIFRLERKESKRRDAMTLTRPVGYREFPVGAPDDAVTFNAETQVSEKDMDNEFALMKGVILSNDDILWPSIGTFDIEFSVKRIQDYITQCWTLDPKWMYDIKPVQTISDDYRKRFVFEVKFSIPTQLHPIPLATASVFFIMETSHYAPKEDLVKVHYVVEGTRFIHIPGTLPFQDRWLWSIISDKMRIQRSIDF